MGALARLRGYLRLAAAQLLYYRGRALLAVVGVAVAVLLVVLLVGLGHGITTTGEQAISWIDSDLWLSGGPIALAPGTLGGVENPISDAHEVTERIERREDIERAQALAFQTVYVSPNTSSFGTVVGVGITGNGSRVLLQDGGGFTSGDTHYADGSYEGPMTREVVIDPGTAERFGVGVNDTLYIGGTIATARQHPFRVVGVSRTFSTFLGTSAAAVHLSELQAVSGTTGTDRASLIRASVTPGADPAAVARELEAETELTVRTNREQVRAVVGNSAGAVAGATALVVVALAVGTALVVNVLARIVYEQREQLALLRATGVRGRSIAGIVAVQGALLGALGGGLALAVAPTAVDAVNGVAAYASGFAGLIKTPPWVFGVGLAVALCMGVAGAAVAGYRAASVNPTGILRP